MTKQLTVFMENRPGRVKAVTEILAQKGHNVFAFTIQDRGEFGLMKLLVDKPQQAYLTLADAGCACALKDILAVTIDDRPGNLHKLLSALLESRVNIKDVHGFVLDPTRRGVCILELDPMEGAADLVRGLGFVVLEDEDLSALI